jgi:hypothetical protein
MAIQRQSMSHTSGHIPRLVLSLHLLRPTWPFWPSKPALGLLLCYFKVLVLQACILVSSRVQNHFKVLVHRMPPSISKSRMLLKSSMPPSMPPQVGLQVPFKIYWKLLSSIPVLSSAPALCLVLSSPAPTSSVQGPQTVPSITPKFCLHKLCFLGAISTYRLLESYSRSPRPAFRCHGWPPNYQR